MTASRPVHEFLLIVVLWLPMAFFLWFALASVLMFPVGWGLDALLTRLFPEVIHDVHFVTAFGHRLEIEVLGATADGRVGVLAFRINPLIYAYGLALLGALVMATPLSPARRALQLAIGVVVVLAVTAWGAGWDILKTVELQLRPAQGLVPAKPDLNPELIALCYQLGYLIFPAVAPVVAWVLSNRAFIESLVTTDSAMDEPAPAPANPSSPDAPAGETHSGEHGP